MLHKIVLKIIITLLLLFSKMLCQDWELYQWQKKVQTVARVLVWCCKVWSLRWYRIYHTHGIKMVVLTSTVISLHHFSTDFVLHIVTANEFSLMHHHSEWCDNTQEEFLWNKRMFNHVVLISQFLQYFFGSIVHFFLFWNNIVFCMCSFVTGQFPLSICISLW